MNDQVLIAGIGNIFLGDDGFGCELARLLSSRSLPTGVKVMDFGIRGFDLAFALLDPWRVVVLIDALPRGGAAGTLYLVEPDLAAIPAASSQDSVDAHSMDPVKVLQLAAMMGKVSCKIYLLGCEPEDCGGEEGSMGLSPVVAAAIPEALCMIDELVARIFEKDIPAVTENSLTR